MPRDVDRLAAAVVAVLEKAVLPLHARLDALDAAAAGQGAEVAHLREALAAADRDLLAGLGGLRQDLAAIRADLEQWRPAPRPPAGDPPTDRLTLMLADEPSSVRDEVH